MTAVFQIRPEHLASLSIARLDHANQRLASYGRQRFPDQFRNYNDQEMDAFVRGVREAAAHYGIEKENDLATFLDFTVMYGATFPEAGWASDILGCDALYGPDKMAVLRFRARESGANL